MASKKKMRRDRNVAIFVVALLAIGVVALLATPGERAPAAIGESGVALEAPSDVLDCIPPSSGITLTLSGFDEQNTGTSTGETHTLWIENGAEMPWLKVGTVSDTGTKTIAGKKRVRVLFGNNSESQGTAAYYTKLVEKQLGCFDETIVGLQKDRNQSAVTTSFFNADDDLINTGIDPQVIGAGGVETMKLQVVGPGEEDYYGDDKILLVFDANTTTYDEVRVGDLSESTVPKQHSGLAESTEFAYEVPAMFGSSRVEYDVTLDAASGVNPGVGDNVTLTGYDKCWFVDADDDTPKLAYEDEDRNDLCAPQINGRIDVS